MRPITLALLTICCPALLLPAGSAPPAPPKTPGKYPVELATPLKFEDEFIEVTSDGTLRRRYRVWGDFEAELATWKARADAAATRRTQPPRTFRLGCILLKDAAIVCPDIPGSDGQPLRATFSTPPDFEKEMRERTTQAYSDFTHAFTGGEVKCEWVFETLAGLTWTSTGKQPAWGCQPRAIAEQLEKALAKYKDAKVDMWVWCAGKPQVLNGAAKKAIPGPPYGISYTQWQLLGGYNIVCCAPHLPLLVHEVNHRYLDNLDAIEGVQLTIFHGLGAMGYQRGDLGYPDLLAVYRSMYLHIIRPAMWRRFSLTGPATAKPEGFSGKLYRWQDVADDCWFRLPLLGKKELAQLAGLPSLEIAAEQKTTWRHFTVGDNDRALLRSPYNRGARRPGHGAEQPAGALHRVLRRAGHRDRPLAHRPPRSRGSLRSRRGRNRSARSRRLAERRRAPASRAPRPARPRRAGERDRLLQNGGTGPIASLLAANQLTPKCPASPPRRPAFTELDLTTRPRGCKPSRNWMLPKTAAPIPRKNHSDPTQ